MKGYKNLREAIIRAHDRGKTQREIADFLGIALGTVNKAIKRFEETGSHEDRKGRGPKKTARSRRNVQRTKGMIERNPTTKANSVRKSVEEGLERNHPGYSGEDRGQLPEAPEGLHRCQRWPF